MTTPPDEPPPSMRGHELSHWYQFDINLRREEILAARRKIEENEKLIEQLEKELRFVEKDERESNRMVAEAGEFERARTRVLGLMTLERLHEVKQGEEREDGGEAWEWPLRKEEYERYSRQMIVPGFGLQGQLNIRNSKVLIIGAGGLGSPAAAYLAGAGVGTLGLVDGDTVEVSNLHRQIAHSTSRVGMKKVDSAICYLKELNPTIEYKAHTDHLSTENCDEIVSHYDLVLDCTDHPTSRYLISDTCVLLQKPLISASAFQTSGQLITLNSPPGKGPCYRCVFPKPPPPESVVGCGEGGIVGGVVGAMGVLQALEAVKFIVGGGLEGKLEEQKCEQKGVKMLLFSGWGEMSFRTIKMKGRREDCFACGRDGLTMEQLKTSMDYVQFCGVVPPVNVLTPEERVSPKEYQEVVRSAKPHILLDVREKEHFGMCHMKGAVNLPFSKVTRFRGEDVRELLPDEVRGKGEAPVYVVCQRGNDSQVVARRLKDGGVGGGVDGGVFVGDLKGGLRMWREEAEPGMPFV